MRFFLVIFTGYFCDIWFISICESGNTGCVCSMCVKGVSSAARDLFRKSFQHISKDGANYFPDHMAKGLYFLLK